MLSQLDGTDYQYLRSWTQKNGYLVKLPLMPVRSGEQPVVKDVALVLSCQAH
jgi:hypothetical protein